MAEDEEDRGDGEPSSKRYKGGLLHVDGEEMEDEDGDNLVDEEYPQPSKLGDFLDRRRKSSTYAQPQGLLKGYHNHQQAKLLLLYCTLHKHSPLLCNILLQEVCL